jgi:hypothetical protein
MYHSSNGCAKIMTPPCEYPIKERLIRPAFSELEWLAQKQRPRENSRSLNLKDG